MEGALQESSDLLLQGIDPAAAPPSGQGLSGKQARSYLLNGIGNAQPIGPDNAPEYMLRLQAQLRDYYDFSDTQLIGLYIGRDFPDITVSNNIKLNSKNIEIILGVKAFLEESYLSYPAEDFQISSKIVKDLTENKITNDETINLIAYSGGGQRAIEAAADLKILNLKYKALLYGAPILPTIDLATFLKGGPFDFLKQTYIPENILNIQPVWGDHDQLGSLRGLIRLAKYSGTIRDDIPLLDYYHAENLEQKEYDYHSIANNPKYKTSYLDKFASVVAGNFQ